MGETFLCVCVSGCGRVGVGWGGVERGELRDFSLAQCKCLTVYLL